MQNENYAAYNVFKARCFELGRIWDLDVWDSDVDELWDINAQDEDDDTLAARLREIHLR